LIKRKLRGSYWALASEYLARRYVNKKQIALLSVSFATVGIGSVLLSFTPPTAVIPFVQFEPKIETDEVLVAAQDVPMGARIGETYVTWQTWPTDAIRQDMIVKSAAPHAMEEVEGSMTRASFVRGEPVRLDKLVKGATGGFMSAILPGGMRAVAIKIDNGGDSEAGGFILPNDRVDVLRIYRDDEATTARGAEIFAVQTLLANVPVLAIGQNIQEENGKKVVNGGNATLELDATQAELVVLAQHIGGNLHLILRSLADSGGPVETVADLRNTDNGGVKVLRFGSGQ
jgi:pilus assembly protein CpaB